MEPKSVIIVAASSRVRLKDMEVIQANDKA
jgi:hypothetical protein